eukprot:GAHX01001082.1.p1 GENE.GAHX01001082.1~~GAHX01001082.1.p1  ORF type:complete len:430 (+),score=86.38 GAHX01001082.1:1471-2760(+)
MGNCISTKSKNDFRRAKLSTFKETYEINKPEWCVENMPFDISQQTSINIAETWRRYVYCSDSCRNMPDFVDYFFYKLYRFYPELRGVFSLQEKSGMIAKLLSWCINIKSFLNSLDKETEAKYTDIKELYEERLPLFMKFAVVYMNKGMEIRHLNGIGMCLFSTLKWFITLEISNKKEKIPLFSKNLKKSWVSAYSGFCLIMIPIMNYYVHNEKITPIVMVDRRKQSINYAIGSAKPEDEKLFYKQITSPTKFDKWKSQQTISETPAFDSINYSIEKSLDDKRKSGRSDILDITNQKDSKESPEKSGCELSVSEISPIKIQNFDTEDLSIYDLNNTRGVDEDGLSLLLNNTLDDFSATYEKATQEEIETYNSNLVKLITKKTCNWNFGEDKLNIPESLMKEQLSGEVNDIDESITAAFDNLTISKKETFK